ncbi:MAG: dihydrolipoyl dehydrogenase [Deltaproteobacteria bacterium RBG_13_52_11b]|nr:MAG: dihydrolipoyl dehydrogenase [Deltaproteobacteria bacterium RBG_13_52_11b]
MYDLCIIGAGPGGYVAAIRAAQHGLTVLLVEKDRLGGTCVNRGCIPAKCFIHDVKVFTAAKRSSVMQGADQLSVNIDKMVSRKRQVVKAMVDGLAMIMKGHGIRVVQGQGEVLPPGGVGVHTIDGRRSEESVKYVILATGAKPGIPPFLSVDGHFVQTTDEALDPKDLPAKLLIIGGGVIGLEMAAIYRLLGSEVTILELLPDIIINEDAEIRKAMRMLMEQQGVKIHLEAKVREVKIQEEKVEVDCENQRGQVEKLQADRVLVATGRVPVLEGIDVQKLGLRMNGPFIKVNEKFETNLPGVFAIGDVVGGMMLAHKASAEAEAVLAKILGYPKRIKPEVIPRCIWGLAEVASVGLTEEEARAKGRRVRVGKFPYMSSGAAQAMDDINGFVKIVGDSESGEILGVHMIGQHATDLISEAATLMTMEATVEDFAEGIKPHPTLSETLMEAALDWGGILIHKLKK